MEFDYTNWRLNITTSGRRVLIIGGCDNYNPHVLRDQYSVIVRINNHVMRQSGQCNILFHTVVPDISYNLLNYCNPSFVFLNEYDHKFLIGERKAPLWAKWVMNCRSFGWNGEYELFSQEEHERKTTHWLTLLQRKYDCKFFTGNVAIARMLMTPCAEVFVYGMDLYVSETGGNKNAKRDSHLLKGNVAFLKDAQAKFKGRLYYDEPLQEALKQYGND